MCGREGRRDAHTALYGGLKLEGAVLKCLASSGDEGVP